AGGLLFVATAQDRQLRAYDRDTGKVLWSYELPSGSEGILATYEIDGRQYLAVPAAAGAGLFSPTFSTDQPAGERAYVVFALPEDDAAIAEFNRRYLKAINDGDIETLASLTTEGHMMIASGGAPLVGKKALVDAMTRAFQTTDSDESWTPEETVIAGDLAHQRGEVVVRAKPKAGG